MKQQSPSEIKPLLLGMMKIKGDKMYYIEKTIEISSAHSLSLDYDSKCQFIHGHNWQIKIYCQEETLNKNGMVIDFIDIKKLIKDPLDHKILNDLFDFNPTAENIAQWIWEQIPSCYKVRIEESEGNVAIYESHPTACRAKEEYEL